MKLSMWILADWLRKYEPEADIKTDNRNLQNVRLFSEDLTFSSSTVYLMPMEYNRVVCSNGNNILTLHSDDINSVLNDILDAFEYYNAFEDTVSDMVSRGCSAADLLKEISGRTGFLHILADATFFMRESYGPDTILSFHSGLESFLAHKMLPVDVLQKINAIPGIRRPDIGSYPIKIPELGTALTTNLFCRSRHMGWLITCSDRMDFTQGEKDLLDNIGHFLSLWMENDLEIKKRNEKTGLFIDILNGNIQKDDNPEERLETFGWYPNDEKQLYVVCPKEHTTVPASYLVNYLDNTAHGIFSFEYEGFLLVIVNHALMDAGQFAESLTSVLRSARYTAGESPVFSHMDQLCSAYEAARLAAHYAALTPAGSPLVLRFQEAIIPYSVSLLKKHAIADLRHPALKTLKNYDRVHDSDLYRTLYCYLEENCSHSAAANKLFIHRSTLIYRIEKIVAMTGIDFSIADERFHLLLSFYIDRLHADTQIADS